MNTIFYSLLLGKQERGFATLGSRAVKSLGPKKAPPQATRWKFGDGSSWSEKYRAKS